MNRVAQAIDQFGRGVLRSVEEMGSLLLLLLSVLSWMIRPP